MIAVRKCVECGEPYLTRLCAASDGRLRKEHRYCVPCRRLSRDRWYVPNRQRNLAELRAASVIRLEEHSHRPCDFCGRPIGECKKTSKRYCSRACVLAMYETKRESVLIEPTARRRA
jgi:hypothetical protein